MSRRRTLLLCAVALGLATGSLSQVSAQSRGVTVLRPEGPDAPRQPEAAPPPKPQPAAPPAVAKCDRAFPTADVKYSNAATFDRALNAQLVDPQHSGVVVDVEPFAPDAPPPRLGAWLSAVQKSGGEIAQREISCSRGFSLMKLLRQIFTPQEDPVYAPAKNFNVVLWVEKTSGNVTQVQFVGRQPA